MKKIPTIRDVAKKAHLSLSTVSLVINNKANVNEETRQKVQTIIDELGYHPRRSARGLASQLSGNIGFILTDDHFSQAEPFYTKIFLGTEFEARTHNYYILLTTVSRTFKASEIPRFLLEHNVDGVIVAGEVGGGWIDYIMGRHLPVVLVDYEVNRRSLSTVLIDNRMGAQAAVDHLIDNGHKKIGFIGGNITHPSIKDRYVGFRETMTNRGVPLNDAWMYLDGETTALIDGYRAAEKFFACEDVPTAIFAANDVMAIGFMQYMKERGMKISEETSIVGFDNIEAGLQVIPRLTTVNVHCEELGSIAVRRIVEMIAQKSDVVTKTVVPVELVVRESTKASAKDVSVLIDA
jgi:LacI family transcriptional regulator